MTDEQADKEEEVTPEGAVEVDEEDLDQVAGGLPLETISLNYKKIGPTQKLVPQDASIGVVGEAEKKL